MLEEPVPPAVLPPGALRPRRAPDAAPDPLPVITVRGEVDFGTVHQLCRRLDDHTGRYRHLTVDLSGAAFYDQAAIDSLALAASRARRAGCRITWIKPPPDLADRPARAPRRGPSSASSHLPRPVTTSPAPRLEPTPP